MFHDDAVAQRLTIKGLSDTSEDFYLNYSS